MLLQRHRFDPGLAQEIKGSGIVSRGAATGVGVGGGNKSLGGGGGGVVLP